MLDENVFTYDYYVISKDYKLIEFNESVQNKYNGIKAGDCCYQAIMQRNSPCRHCPIAGNSESNCPIYYNTFYKDWIQAIFSRIDADRYAVICRPVDQTGIPTAFGETGEEQDEETIYKITGFAANDMLKRREFRSRLIIEAMSGLFESMHFIDLDEDGITEIKKNASMLSDDFPVSLADPQSYLWKYCDKNIVDEFSDQMRKFTRLATLPRRCEGKKFIAQEFKGRDQKWYSAGFIPIELNSYGQYKSFIFTIRSINDMKLKETRAREELISALKQAENANAAKSRFLYSMSHDIRTPMNAILGYSAVVENNIGDAIVIRKAAQNIKTSGDWLMGMINNVLEMSAIESGNIVLKSQKYNLKYFFDDIKAVFADEYKKNGIICIEKKHIRDYTVLCDVERIRQIAVNIVSNAIKYTMPGGEITIELEEIPYEKTGYIGCRFTVTDTGIGISGDYLPHIYESFSREKTVTENNIKGSGLGLGIVKKLVEMMNGKISIKSTYGSGTSVMIDIPFRLAADERTPEKCNIELPRGLRALVVEDQEMNRELLINMLRMWGIESDSAWDGVDCLDHYLVKDYDFILMDIQMPNMDGNTATRIIRKIDDKSKANVPIIAVSANALEQDRKRAFEAGVDDFIAKPVDTNKLKTAIFEQIAR